MSSSRLFVIKGDILKDTGCRYIVHQCNCVSDKANYLAADMFMRYPEADVYHRRQKRSTPGTIDVTWIKSEGISIIAMFAQRYPGTSRWPNDNQELRRQWFKEALEEIGKLPSLSDGIAFPYGIGCGAAGGLWRYYEQMLEEFTEKHSDSMVALYKLN